jgi:hypothetical protein
MVLVISVMKVGVSERVNAFGSGCGIGQKILMIMRLAYRRIHRIGAQHLWIRGRYELLASPRRTTVQVEAA